MENLDEKTIVAKEYRKIVRDIRYRNWAPFGEEIDRKKEKKHWEDVENALKKLTKLFNGDRERAKIFALLIDFFGDKPDLIEKIMSWDIINQSPYSFSFYNSNDIDWGYKPEGSLRVSNHWNFVSRGETHCILEGTDENEQINKFILARYENGKYHKIKEF